MSRPRDGGSSSALPCLVSAYCFPCSGFRWLRQWDCHRQPWPLFPVPCSWVPKCLGSLPWPLWARVVFPILRPASSASLSSTDQRLKVSRTRYTIGLVMFAVPIVFGWLAPYAADLIPGYPGNELTYAIVGDLLLLVSLFVLGGDFWDKLRALFIGGAKAVFPKTTG